MGIWVSIALIAGSYLLQRAIAKYWPDQKEEVDFARLSIPTVTEGIPIPVVYGRARIRNPNVIWYADIGATPVTQKIDTEFGGSEDVTIAMENKITIAFGLSLGGLSDPELGTHKLYGMFVNDIAIWDENNGTPVAPAFGPSSVVNFVNGTGIGPAALGGRGNGGRVFGSFDFHNGSLLHPVDFFMKGGSDGEFEFDNVSQFYFDSLPHYLGLTYVTVQFDGIGENGAMPDVSFELEIIPDALGNPEVSGVIGTDANPAEVIFEMLTDDWRGAGLSTAFIDTTSFLAAAATLDTEGNGYTRIVFDVTNVADLLREVLRQIDGMLYIDQDTQKIKLVLVREDYTVGSLPVLSTLNVREDGVRSWKATAWNGGFNQVRAVFQDRERGFQDTVVYAMDQANVTNQDGRIRAVEIQLPGVKNKDLANAIVNRELQAMSIPTTKLELRVNKDAIDLNPNDLFRFTWADFAVVDMVFRVERLDHGTLDQGTITIIATRDKFDTQNRVVFVPPGRNPDGGNFDIGGFGVIEPVEPTDIYGFETPRFITFQVAETRQGQSPDDSFVTTFAAQPNSPRGQQLSAYFPEAKLSAQTTFQREVPAARAVDMTPFARLLTQLTFDDLAVMPEVRIKDVTVASALMTATESEINTGANLLIIGTEIMAYEGFTDPGDGTVLLTNVWRGVLDTPKLEHLPGSQVWFLTAARLAAVGRTRFNGDEAINVRIIPTTGVVDSSGGGVEQACTLAFRAIAWYPPGDLSTSNFAWNDEGTRPPPASVLIRTEIAASSFSVDWKRKDRDDITVLKNDNADVIDLAANACTYFLEHKTETIAEWLAGAPGGGVQGDLDGAGWDGPAGVAADVAIPRAIFTELSEWGPTLFRVRTERDRTLDRPDLSAGFVYPPFQAFFRAAVRSFRQMLLNQDFTNGSDNWTTEAGTPVYSGADALGGIGARVGTVTAADCRISQTFTINGLDPDNGSRFLLSFYGRGTGGDADDTVRGQIVTSFASTGAVETPPQTWTKFTVSATPAFGDTTLEIELTMGAVTDTTPSTLMDSIGVRIGRFTVQQLVNEDFETGDTTGWSEDVGVWRVLGSLLSATALTGADSLFGPTGVATGTISQDLPAFPSDFGTEGQWIVLDWWDGQANSDSDTYELRLIFRDVADNVVGIASSGIQTPIDAGGSGIFRERSLYAQIPSNTDNVKMEIIATRDGGAGDIDIGWDQFEYRIYNRRVRHAQNPNRWSDYANYTVAQPFNGYWRFNTNVETSDIVNLAAGSGDLAFAGDQSADYSFIVDANGFIVGEDTGDGHFIAADNTVMDPVTLDSVAMYYEAVVLVTGAGHLIGKFTGSTGYKAELDGSGLLTVTYADGTNTDTISFPGFVADVECMFLTVIDRAAGFIYLFTNLGDATPVAITATLTLANTDIFTIGATGGAATDAAFVTIHEAGVILGTDAEAGLRRATLEKLRENMFIEQLEVPVPLFEDTPRIASNLLHYLGTGSVGPKD